MSKLPLPKYKIQSAKIKAGLKTPRLDIRPLKLSDYKSWQYAHSSMADARNEWDESNWDDSELTLAKFKKKLADDKKNADADHMYSFGIFMSHNKELIGIIHVMDISRAIFQNGYIGYRIFNPYWGNGFGPEAVELFSQWFLKASGLHRLEAGISPKNKNSLRLIKKTSYRKEGLSLRRLLLNGKWEDMQLFAATTEDF